MLLARIRAQLRQHEQSEAAVFAIGPYTFKPASMLLLDERGHKIWLTEKETSILKYLYWAGYRVVSRETPAREVLRYNARSPAIRLKPTSTGYAKRSRKIPPSPSFW